MMFSGVPWHTNYLLYQHVKAFFPLNPFLYNEEDNTVYTQYSIAHHYVSSYLQWSRSRQFTAFDSQEFDYDHLQSSILAATELKQLPTV